MSTITSGVLRIVIPGNPDPCLSPNSRSHWRRKAAAIKDLRRTTFYACPWDGREDEPMIAGPVRVTTVIAWAKGRKTMDGDNAQAMCKAVYDGITDAGVWADDRQCTFEPVVQVRDPSGVGFIVIEVSE